jgi:hypothetical protein
MANADLKFGSPAWRTHMRRSLAQRKRHGEKITDIEGLINYIEAKGPGKGATHGKAKKGRNSASASSVHQKAQSKRSSKYKSSSKNNNKKARPQKRNTQAQVQKGITVVKAGSEHEFFLGI